MLLILKIIWLFLPAGIANVSAALSAIILPFWNYPVDCGKKFKGKRIFGVNKTLRGLTFGLLAGEIVFILQRVLSNSFPSLQKISWLDYNLTAWSFGLVISFGALFGDLIKSFFKRQYNVHSGNSWFPFDQIDWVIGTLFFTSFYVQIPALGIIITVSLGFILHLSVKFLGYLLGLEKRRI
jgi:CDP-2,3-bis-(O-geranylgeranyl)-sn-glycerol synthase